MILKNFCLFCVFCSRCISLTVLRKGLFREESAECADGVGLVECRTCLAHRMHGPESVAHVDTAQVHLGGEYVAKGGAAGDIAVVDKCLAGHPGFLADGFEYGRRVCIGHVFAAGVDFDYRATSNYWMIGGVVFFGIVGMESMGVVGRNHE